MSGQKLEDNNKCPQHNENNNISFKSQGQNYNNQNIYSNQQVVITSNLKNGSFGDQSDQAKDQQQDGASSNLCRQFEIINDTSANDATKLSPAESESFSYQMQDDYDGYGINLDVCDDEALLLIKNYNKKTNLTKLTSSKQRKPGSHKDQQPDSKQIQASFAYDRESLGEFSQMDGEEANNLTDVGYEPDYCNDISQEQSVQDSLNHEKGLHSQYKGIQPKVNKKLSLIVEDEQAGNELDHQFSDGSQKSNKQADDTPFEKKSNELLNLDDNDSSSDHSQKNGHDLYSMNLETQNKQNICSQLGALDQEQDKPMDQNLNQSTRDGSQTNQAEELPQMSSEQLTQLKLLMGSNFKDIKLPEPEEALPIRSSGRYYQEDDFMTRKLKNLQKREQQRKKNAQDQYERIRLQQKLLKKQNRCKNQGSGSSSESSSEDDSAEEGLRIKRNNDIDNGFDPQELKQKYDGWEFFKRRKIQNTMVQRYCVALDEDYMKNKVTIVAHINHIFDLYLHQRRPFMLTYADVQDRYSNRQGSAYTKQLYYQGASGSAVSQMAIGINVSSSTSTNQIGQPKILSESESTKNLNDKNLCSKTQNNKVKKNAVGSKGSEQAANENISTEDSDSKKIGLMNPDASNQIVQSINYYARKSAGIIYQNLKEDKNLEYYYQVGLNDYLFDVRSLMKPIRKVYINFDKDIAHRMFGYRIRFVPKEMRMYKSKGIPCSDARQFHKPIHFYSKQKIANLLNRYCQFKNYHSRQTVVTVLDSDNEDDRVEIEKNRKAIQKLKVHSDANPKIKKNHKRLPWVYGLDPKWELRDPSPSELNNQKSMQYLKRTRFPHQKRFQSNTLRFSQKTLNQNGDKSNLSTGLSHQITQQVLQVNKQFSFDHQDLPKSEQKIIRGNTLLFDRQSIHNQKLNYSDQKARSNTNRLDAAPDINNEIIQIGNTFCQQKPDQFPPADLHQQQNFEPNQRKNQIQVNLNALRNLQIQLDKQKQLVNNHHLGKQTINEQPNLIEYHQKNIMNINQTLEQLERQKNKLQIKIQLQKQHLLDNQKQRDSAKQTLVIDQEQKFKEKAIQEQSNLDPPLEQNLLKSCRFKQNNARQSIPNNDTKYLETASQNSVEIKENLHDGEQEQLMVEQSQAKPQKHQFERVSSNFYNMNNHQNQMREVNQFKNQENAEIQNQFDRSQQMDQLNAHQDYFQDYNIQNPQNERLINGIPELCQSIRIQSGTRCLDNSNINALDDPHFLNVQILNERQPHLGQSGLSPDSLPEEQEKNNSKQNIEPPISDMCNTVGSIAIVNQVSQIKFACNQSTSHETSLLKKICPSKLVNQPIQSSQPQHLPEQTVRIRQRSSKLSIQSAQQQESCIQLPNQDSFPQHKLVKSTRPISKRKRQSMLCHVVSPYKISAESCAQVNLNRGDHQLCSLSSSHNQYKVAGSPGSTNQHRDGQKFECKTGVQQHLQGAATEDQENLIDIDAKQLDSPDNDKCFKQRSQFDQTKTRMAIESSKDYQAAKSKIKFDQKTIHVVCEPQSASSIIQTNVQKDMSPILPFVRCSQAQNIQIYDDSNTVHYPNGQQPYDLKYACLTEAPQVGGIHSQSSSSQAKNTSNPAFHRKQPSKHDKKRQSTFTCYNKDRVDSRHGLATDVEHLGQSQNSFKCKNSFNEVDKLQAISLNLDHSHHNTSHPIKPNQSSPSHRHQTQPYQKLTFEKQGQVVCQSQDSNLNRTNFYIGCGGKQLYKQQIETSDDQKMQGATLTSSQINALPTKQLSNSPIKISNQNQQKSILSKKSDLQHKIVNSQIGSCHIVKSCPRSEYQSLKKEKNILDYSHNNQQVLLRQPQGTMLGSHIKSTAIQFSSTLDNRKSIDENITAAANRRSEFEADLIKQSFNRRIDNKAAAGCINNLPSTQSAHIRSAPRSKDQAAASPNTSSNPVILNRTGSRNLEKRQFGSMAIHIQDTGFTKMAPRSLAPKNEQTGDIQAQNLSTISKLEDKLIHLSGEHTLKGQNCRIATQQNSSQIRNAQLIETIHNNLKLQQKCIEIFENNQQLLSQLKQYGKQQRSDLHSESHNRHQSQLIISSNHNSATFTPSTLTNQESKLGQNHKFNSNLISSFEHQSTGLASIKRNSQEQPFSQSQAITKKVINLKQKNHQKFMSLGQGILYPKTYLEQRSSQVSSMAASNILERSSRINDWHADKNINNTDRIDQTQTSVLFPDFLNRSETKEIVVLPNSSSTSKHRAVKSTHAGLTSVHHSVERVDRKLTGAHNNKIASMNGQIILNLNQSLFRNMNKQMLSKQLKSGSKVSDHSMELVQAANLRAACQNGVPQFNCNYPSQLQTDRLPSGM